MKRILVLLLMVTTLAAYSQTTAPTNVMSTVNTVKPKPGQKMAFETAYKLHTAKFHKADEKISVYEILSGEYAGYYHLVNGGRSYADMDKERADAAVHSLDLDKTFFPLLEDTRNGTYRFIDTLSLRPEVEADKSLVTVSHLKPGLNMNDYRRELSRAVKILKTLKGGFFENLSYTFLEQIWDGSDQVTVSIRNLKDGFKSLEAGYFASPAPTGSPNFREAYTKEYGGTAWDDRVKLLDGAVVKTEQYISRSRKDLSSQ